MIKQITIRQEQPTDYDEVFSVIEAAFKNEKFSDHAEQFLVIRLRNSDAFIPELSLAAEVNNKVVGHILLTRLKIKNDRTETDSLALAPLSVHPDFQRKGIGAMLITEAHRRARNLGFKSVVVLGHAEYYARFGYQRADKFGIELKFDAPQENRMVLELVKNGLKGVYGEVIYPKEFMIE